VKTWYLVVATAVATFLLLIAGGTVHPSGSSLACPDWPTCFGTLLPEMKGAVLFEHGHRLIATLVGAMTWAVALCLWRSRPEDRRLRWLGVLAAGVVVLQGVLGGVTVIYRLPVAVSTAHLGLALAFFGLQVYLCFAARPQHRSPRVRGEAARDVRRAFMIGAAAVYSQILLGAYLRHTGAGYACTDIPLCQGEWWPDLVWGRLHMVHRFFGLLLLPILGWVSVFAVRRAGAEPGVRAMIWAGPLVLLLQVAIGVWMVLASIDWVPASIHTGMAAILLGTQLIGWFSLVSFGPTQVSASERHEIGTDSKVIDSARSST
jgi:heme A synthase